MMDTMINEEGLTFKDVEEYFFKYICELGRRMNCKFLEKYDRYLMKTRDRAAYRHWQGTGSNLLFSDKVLSSVNNNPAEAKYLCGTQENDRRLLRREPSIPRAR